MNYDTLLLAVYVVILIFLGLTFLLAPSRIQKIAVSSMHKGYTSTSESFVSYISSRAFLWNVRFVGVLALLMAGFMIWASLSSRLGA
jgi:hypothetical protein